MRDSYLILDEYVSLCFVLNICMLIYTYMYNSDSPFNFFSMHSIKYFLLYSTSVVSSTQTRRERNVSVT